MAANVPVVDANGASRLIAADDFGGGTELLFQRTQPAVNGVDVTVNNGLPVSMASPIPTVGALSALNAAVQVPVVGAGSVAFAAYGTYSVTLAFEACFDQGTPTTWFPLMAARLDTNTQNTTIAIVNQALAWSAAVDGGMTYVRARVSSYTSGTVNVIVAPGAASLDPAPVVAMAASTSKIGFAQAAGIWQDTTSTALAANAVFTGTGRDFFVAATAAAWANASTYGAEYRLMAEADVAGTLYLEVSRDNITFRRIKAAPLATADASSVFYGEIIYKPITRYGRLAFVNGAGAQSQFMAQETYLSVI